MGAAIFFGDDLENWITKSENGELHPFVVSLSEKHRKILINYYGIITESLSPNKSELAYREACLDLIKNNLLKSVDYYVDLMIEAG